MSGPLGVSLSANGLRVEGDRLCPASEGGGHQINDQAMVLAKAQGRALSTCRLCGRTVTLVRDD